MESARKPLTEINNDLYDALGERWYTAEDDPVALLRAESRLRNPWVAETLSKKFLGRKCKALDVGCGGGFLSNALAKKGHEVTGIDASEESLKIARRYDETASVDYRMGDAYALPFADASFDAVCAMDFLEHVDDPAKVVAEAGRVLKKDGLFFFHTFNRNFLSWLVVIKGVEWFVKNTPKNLHVYPLFVKPEELKVYCEKGGLVFEELHGSRPKLSRAFWRMLRTGIVPSDFEFVFSLSTRVAYTGMAKKR
ncbi:MAG: bifunctional 2-polyprenyl-6-hydroxyphenol methylase/3-demethylubiquinol 3-O-methyltransferase UbiG [bacterium]